MKLIERLQTLYDKTIETIKGGGYSIQDHNVMELQMSEAPVAEPEAPPTDGLTFDPAVAAKQTQEIHSLLFEDDQVDIAVPADEAPSEDKVDTPKAEDSTPEDVKKPTDAELRASIKKEVIAELKEESKKKEQEAEDKAPVEDPLVHNPEAKVEVKAKFATGDPKSANHDDPTSAFFHVLNGAK